MRRGGDAGRTHSDLGARDEDIGVIVAKPKYAVYSRRDPKTGIDAGKVQGGETNFS